MERIFSSHFKFSTIFEHIYLFCSVKFDRLHFVYLLILFSTVFCREISAVDRIFSVSLGILSLWFPVSNFKSGIAGKSGYRKIWSPAVPPNMFPDKEN
jgi:hypothetical protein